MRYLLLFFPFILLLASCRTARQTRQDTTQERSDTTSLAASRHASLREQTLNLSSLLTAISIDSLSLTIEPLPSDPDTDGGDAATVLRAEARNQPARSRIHIQAKGIRTITEQHRQEQTAKETDTQADINLRHTEAAKSETHRQTATDTRAATPSLAPLLWLLPFLIIIGALAWRRRKK